MAEQYTARSRIAGSSENNKINKDDIFCVCMRKTYVVLACIIAGIFIASLVLAAEKENKTASDTGVKNMTYGQCVSAAAAVKNTCYSTVKSTYNDCVTNAKAQTDSKNAVKQCSATYKKDKNTCKQAFKATKKNECATIKHNFFETMRYAFA
jgi:hypothetical protein